MTSIISSFVAFSYNSFPSPLVTLSLSLSLSLSPPSIFPAFLSIFISLVLPVFFCLSLISFISPFLLFLFCLCFSFHFRTYFVPVFLIYTFLSIFFTPMCSQLRMHVVLWHLAWLKINEELGASNVSDQEAVADVVGCTNPPVTLTFLTLQLGFKLYHGSFPTFLSRRICLFILVWRKDIRKTFQIERI